jgi:hypothetical protein
MSALYRDRRRSSRPTEGGVNKQSGNVRSSARWNYPVRGITRAGDGISRSFAAFPALLGTSFDMSNFITAPIGSAPNG